MTINLDEHGQPIWGNSVANTARKRSYRDEQAREEKQAAKLLDEVAVSALTALAAKLGIPMTTLARDLIAKRQTEAQRSAVERLAVLVRGMGSPR